MIEAGGQTISSTRSRVPARVLPGLVMLGVLIGGFVMALLTPATYRIPEDADLWTGEGATAYERNFNRALPIRQFAVDAWGVMQYSLFREGRDGVLIGLDGWLFTTEEFQHYPNEAAEIGTKLEFIRNVHRILEQRGVQLVVAVVPAKARVHSENLGRYRLPNYAFERYDSFRWAVEAMGIPAPDLVGPLISAKATEPVFLRTDTHWTPFGAQIAARVLAAAVNPLDYDRFATVQQDHAVMHQGDLLSFVPLGAWQERIGHGGDLLRIHETVSESGETFGLFGSFELPITLVGTSYSANPLWNFEGALKEAFGADLLNYADEGLGPIFPMRSYLQSAEFIESPPEIVVWEIPERSLPVAYTSE